MLTCFFFEPFRGFVLCCRIPQHFAFTARQEYTAHWNYDNETEKFFFKVEVKNVSGWIAFGVSRLLFPNDNDQWNRRMMEYYDILVGGIYDDNKTNYYKVCNLCMTNIRNAVAFNLSMC